MVEKHTQFTSQSKKSYKKYQTIILSIEKGTKRKRIDVLKKISDTQINKIESLVCGICKNTIPTSDICRILVMRDKDKNRSVQHIHFFWPCWNPKFLDENDEMSTVINIGFSIPEKLQISKKGLRDLRNNLEFWN